MIDARATCTRCGVFLLDGLTSPLCDPCAFRLDAEEQQKRAKVIVRIAWLALLNAAGSLFPFVGLFVVGSAIALWFRLRANMREPEPTPSLYEALGPNARLVRLTLRWVPVAAVASVLMTLAFAKFL